MNNKILMLTLTGMLSTTLCFAMGNRAANSSKNSNAPQQVSDTSANAQTNATMDQGNQGAANNVSATGNPSAAGDQNAKPGSDINAAPSSDTGSSRPGSSQY
jgi:hypothetical protein